MLQVCLQMFFSEGLNRPLGLCAWAKSSASGRNAAQAYCLSSPATITKHGPLLMSEVHLNTLFCPILGNLPILLKIPNHTWKANALYCSMTPLNLDFVKSYKPQRKRKQVIYELDAWKDVPGPTGGRDSPCLILEFSSLQNTAENRSSHFCSSKPRSEVTSTKKDNAFFTPRTATPTTWSHLKFHNIP